MYVSVPTNNNGTGLDLSSMVVHWDALGSDSSAPKVVKITIETSASVDFQIVQTRSVRVLSEKLRTDSTNFFRMALDKSYSPFTLAKLYVRVRTVGEDERHSAWSNPNPEWTIASECGNRGYLDTSIFTNTSTDPLSWKCQECPAGANCDGPITWKKSQQRLDSGVYLENYQIYLLNAHFPARA